MRRTLQALLATSLVVIGLAGGLVFSTGYAQTQTPTPSSAAPASSTPDEETPRTISVTGVGRITLTPDEATVGLGVQTEAESAASALSKNNTQMTAVLNALQRANVARTDIRTRSLLLFPRYETPDPESATAQLAGYVVTNIVEVRMRNLNNVGQLLDAAVNAGANSVEGIQFQASDASGKLDEAYEAALDDARQKAQKLAALANGELGEVLEIHDASFQSPLSFAAEGLGGGGGQVPVEPGTQSIEVMLQVTWRLR